MILPTLLGPKRLALFESQIIKEGGILCSPLDVKSGKSNPAYLVVEDSLLNDPVQLEKHVKGLTDQRRTVVRTRWLSDSIKQCRCLSTKEYEPLNKSSVDNSVKSSTISNHSPPKRLKLNVESNEELGPGVHSKTAIDTDVSNDV